VDDRAAWIKGKGWAGWLTGLPARLLFPPVCPACRRVVAEPFTLCGTCWPKLRFIERPWCEVLGTPFSHEIGDGIVSAAAIADPPPFARARSAVSYNGVARRMVLNLKFGDRTELAPTMARWMMRPAAELLAQADAVVPVPLHRGRFLRRRFNQSAELARALCALSGRPFLPDAVVRIRATRQQVGLGAREREDNVRGAFRVPAAAEIGIRGRRILVVDDVYTTGMTVSAVARALKKAGAAEVDVLTFARVLPGEGQSETEGKDFRLEEADAI
jgi:ComF family protein